MPEYLSPGVYVEEIEIGSKPIEGVGTSTAAFLGIAEKGPLNRPTLIATQKDFTSTFGGNLKESYLAYAVDGFFRNGGKRCYVVRVARNAKKATATINSAGGTPLMTINAQSEGKWGNDITINVQEASSGSTTLFLSSLIEDVDAVEDSIKLSSTTGLSKGVKIVLSDGVHSDTLTVTSKADNTVNFSSADLTHPYKKNVTSAFIQIQRGGTGTNVKSATGFSSGTVVVLQSADTSISPVYVTLNAVKQPDRRLEWETPLGSAIDGASCVDINGVKTNLDFIPGAADINKGAGSIPKSSLSPPASVNLLKKGDKVTFASGTKTQTLTIKNIGADIEFIEAFIENYTASNTRVTAMTSSRTSLFADTYKKANFKDNGDGTATIALDKGVKGLKKNDYLTLIKYNDNNTTSEVQIAEVIDDKTVKLTGAPGADFQYDNTKVRFTLKTNGKEILVSSPGGFSASNLIDIDAGGGTKGRHQISAVEDNRITFEPGWSGVGINSAPVAAKQWLATSVRSLEFQVIAVYGDNETVEKFDKLSIAGTGDRYFAKEGVINKFSTLILVRDARATPGGAPTSPNDLPEPGSTPLLKGSDGDSIEAADYIGTSTPERTGLVALETVDDVNILVIPDLMMSFGGGNGRLSPDDVEQVQNAMISHCERLKDRFAILDPIRNQTVQEVHAWRLDNLDSKYAAIYYPWIKVSDPIGAENSTSRFVPPSGHIAGIYARSDIERGVHKAPANEVVSGVTEAERTVTSGEQDVLNPDGINCIRAFPGRGIRVWGARTISSDPLWKYVNVRRMFLYLEESIDESTQWVVFEPNNQKLWGRVRATITEFLTRVWRDGALMGMKAEEAFFVKCDETTMTKSDIDNGRLIVIIGIAPVKPAEFVIFRIAQWAGGSSVTE